MIEWINKLSISKKLAGITFLLGVIALIIGDSSNNNGIYVNAKEMALSTINNNEKIEASVLADWLIEGKYDYTLVDLRNEKEFSEYNIPSSYNFPIESILSSDLMRNQKILLYGNDDVASAQAWFILKSSNYKAVYILKGGLSAWKNEILFPKLDVNATPEQMAAFERIKQVSLYFGGTPQIVSGGTATSLSGQPNLIPTLPKLTVPKGKIGTRIQKKKEGC